MGELNTMMRLRKERRRSARALAIGALLLLVLTVGAWTKTSEAVEVPPPLPTNTITPVYVPGDMSSPVVMVVQVSGLQLVCTRQSGPADSITYTCEEAKGR